MGRGLVGTSDSCEVFHRFQLVGANDVVLLAVSVQALPPHSKNQHVNIIIFIIIIIIIIRGNEAIWKQRLAPFGFKSKTKLFKVI